MVALTDEHKQEAVRRLKKNLQDAISFHLTENSQTSLIKLRSWKDHNYIQGCQVVPHPFKSGPTLWN